MAKKALNKKFDMSKFFGSAIIVLFFLFLGSFIYEALEEIWCNNCQTWHAPNEESRRSKIN